MNFLSVLYAKAGIIVDGVTTLNNTATALTPATNDNSTNIATTGYVKNQNYYPYPTGTTAQYVRGDGSLATFTQTGGGGSSVSYYLNGSVSQGTIGGNAYYEMSKNAIIGTNADFSINADGYVAQFVTDAGDPALLSIPGGNWNFEMWFSASSGGGTPSFYVELYKYDGTTLTLIASGSAAPESITGGTSTDLYITALAVPTTTLTLTDRLAVRVYVNHSGRTITLHTQNGHLCQVITSFSTGLTALNGLTAQVQNFAVGAGGSDFNISSVIDTHTFNLPTASATKRGALSSIDWSAFDAKVDFGDLSATSPLNYNGSGVFSIAQSSTSTNGYLSSTDWNTFNNKQNALTLTTTGTSGAATLVGGVLNIPQYQAVLTNPVTGTGTTGYITKWVSGSAVGNSIIIESGGGIGIGMSPSYTLDVNGTARIGTALTINGTSEASTALTIRQSASLAIALAMSNRNQNHTWGFVVDTAVVDDKNFGIYNITNSNFPLVINATTNAATFSSSVTASSLIKSGGTSTQYLMADGSTSTLTNPITGTGTTNYLPKFTGTSALGDSLLQETTNAIGLNVTPSAWGSLSKSIQIGNKSSLFSFNNATTDLGLNVFWNSSNTDYNYIENGFVSLYRQSSGQHIWLNAPSGTAGNAVSFTQAMTLDASGRLGIGTTSPLAILDVFQTGQPQLRVRGTAGANHLYQDSITGTSNSDGLFVGIGSDQIGYIFQYEAKDLVFGTNTTERMRITSAGNVGIGTTSPGAPLQVTGSASNAQNSIFLTTNSYTSLSSGSLLRIGHTGTSGNVVATIENLTAGGTGNGALALNASSGNVLIGTTTDAGYKLDVNGTARVSGVVTATGNVSSYGQLRLETSAYGSIVVGSRSSQTDFQIYNTGNIFRIYDGTSDALSINTSGAATFSSTLNAKAGSYINGASNSDWGFSVENTGTTNANGLYVNIGSSSTGIPFRVDKGGSSLFSIANSGAATFSSSVTANGTGGSPALNIRATDTNFALASILGNQTGDVSWLLMSGYPVAGDFTIRQSDTIDALTIKKTTGAATFASSVTAGGNFELNSATTGLKSNFYDTNFYASSASYWNVTTAAAATYGALLFLQGYGGTTKGYVYWDSSGFGLLNNVGGWSVRANYSSSYGGLLNGSWEASGTFTATNFIVPGGTSAQFLKADGSLDSNVYLTATSSTFSYTASVTLSPTWQNTGVSSTNLGSGTYLVNCFANDAGVGGGQYDCTYAGIMYFYAGGTNGSNANEIVLHHTGHADNGRYIYLRTLSTVTADGKTYLQISGNGTNSAASNYQLTFKKLL